MEDDDFGNFPDGSAGVTSGDEFGDFDAFADAGGSPASTPAHAPAGTHKGNVWEPCYFPIASHPFQNMQELDHDRVSTLHLRLQCRYLWGTGTCSCDIICTHAHRKRQC